MGSITVYLADDNLLVREGVRALVDREPDLEVVGAASDYAELVEAPARGAPGARHRHPHAADLPAGGDRGGQGAAQTASRNGIVVLSQYDDPEYAISLLSEGAAGYAYLLKDRIAEGDQLVQAIRTVATGGTSLDPAIVDTLMRPVATNSDLRQSDEELLRFVAEGRPIKAIALARQTTAEAVADDIERMFLHLAAGRPPERQRAAPTPVAAHRDRRPGGAGRDAQPAAAGRHRPEGGP